MDIAKLQPIRNQLGASGTMKMQHRSLSTFGGIHESRALHWNDETYQRLGRVVYLVMSGSREKARRGYVEFYQLKRMFMRDEFDSVVEVLDRFRERKGFVSLTTMIRSISDQMMAYGNVQNVDEHPSTVQFETEETQFPVTPVPNECGSSPRLRGTSVRTESVEQMSLF